MTDARRHAPATMRNRDAILAVLRDALPADGLVLEIASGSGEHIVHFAAALPALVWQPSDPDVVARASTDAWVRESGLANVRPALALDAAAAPWPIERADAILCINMVHISSWSATLGLFAGAARLLPPGGPLYLYGPYRVAGAMAPGNVEFDADLRRRDPAWGVRDLEKVVAAGADAGLRFDRTVKMPANNLSVLFRRAGAEAG
jgi:SAM-dependent methyltransferase